MNLKRMFLLGVMAVTAVAFASSALGSGGEDSEWTHEGSPLEGHTEIELSGTISLNVSSAEASMECPVHVVLTPTSSGEGEVASYETTFAECQGGGSLKDCVVDSEKNTKEPWKEDIKKEHVIVTNVTVDTYYKKDPKCPYPGIESTTKEITIVPLKKGAPLGTVELEGATSVTVEGVPFPVPGQLTGTLEATGEDAETYELSE